MIRTVALFLDDFSVFSEELSNVYLYDFGYDSIDYFYDHYQMALMTSSQEMVRTL